MLDMIVDKLPELAKLERHVMEIEQQRATATARAHNLIAKVEQTRAEDIEREAQALNSGRSIPAPKAPKLAEQLADAEHDLAVVSRRLELATGARDHYVSENLQEIMDLLREQREADAQRLARSANNAQRHLLAMFRCEDEARDLARRHAPPAETNQAEPASSTIIFPIQTAANTMSGPRRGDLEATLQHLQSLAEDNVAVVGSEADGAA